MGSRYVNPFTEFGFKRLLGEEASKPQLIDFLNALIPSSSPIRDITFQDRLGLRGYGRRIFYDVHCESSDGERFFVQMQKAKHNYFKDRSGFYATFPIREQAEKGGDWDFRLTAIYCVGILDFIFKKDDLGDGTPGQVVHTVQLKDQANRIFYDKLTFVYVELPNFQKPLAELESRLDLWLYFLRQLESFDEIPRIFGSPPVFTEAAQRARIAAFTEPEHEAYEESVKIYRDLNNVIETAREEGRVKGRQERERTAKLEMFERLKARGMTEAEARELLGLF
jgi:predicted transposase/invertase (TIGR01784 family)